jgi:receptor expression-enhancing protein 1/2/3/4
MLLGYVYPAYECFKIVERKKPELEHLRFWCQYWIIIAMLTVLERVGDILVSWYVPFTWQQISTALCSYCWWLVAFYNVLRTHAG